MTIPARLSLAEAQISKHGQPSGSCALEHLQACGVGFRTKLGFDLHGRFFKDRGDFSGREESSMANSACDEPCRYSSSSLRSFVFVVSGARLLEALQETMTAKSPNSSHSKN